ncbi:MAG: GSCFA domain-containing protein [Muribaculaceae bacterium]|nr:GSCFA domain-containing protein [Muribaculaceae bacterium]
MQFRTEIAPLPGLTGAITHSTPVWTIGSCFADNIGDRMLAQGFDVEVNPLGTLYNPLSILNSVVRLVDEKNYTPAEFFEHERKYRNYDFHSLFARSTPDDSARFINERLDALRQALPSLDTVILTFGSARCFRLKATGQPVANCHKQHPDLFELTDLSVDTCVEAISETISLLRRVAPGLRRVILTVSPIRHKAYGLHTDRLSKSTLLLACDKVIATAPDATLYFPSYEIMMDDLRDYRFYAADMVHPSEVAVDYIYDIFSRTFYNEATMRQAAANLKTLKRSLHRPSGN